MAKIKRIVLTLNKKVSDNNYGSFGADVTLEAELEPGDDLKEVKENLRKSATRDLERALEMIKPEEKTKTKIKKN
jgi:hypothetical protein